MPSYVALESSGLLLQEDGASRVQLQSELFTTPILDNFNRANEVPLSAAAGWETARWDQGSGFIGRTLNVEFTTQCRLYNASSNNQNYASQVRSAVLSADQEAYFTVANAGYPSLNGYGVLLRADAPGVAAGAGRAYFGGVVSDGSINITASIRLVSQANYPTGRLIASTYYPFGTLTQPPARIGFRAYGVDPVTLDLWWWTAATGWIAICHGFDYGADRIVVPGRLGMVESAHTSNSAAGMMDDFSGGEATGSLAENFPGLTGTLLDTLTRRAWPEPKTSVTTKARPTVGQVWPRRH